MWMSNWGYPTITQTLQMGFREEPRHSWLGFPTTLLFFLYFPHSLLFLCEQMVTPRELKGAGPGGLAH